MVDDGDPAVGRQVVRAKEPAAESRADARHRLLDIAGFRDVADFVHQQAVSITIESLTLGKPENSFPFKD